MSVGFVIEHALGHVTHAQVLQAAAQARPNFASRWFEVPYMAGDLAGRLPGLPFSLRLSLRARQMMQRARPRPQAWYFHTQALTPLCAREMARTPSVISLDATPANFSGIAAAYDSKVATGFVAGIKHRRFESIFRRARGLVAFSHWVRDSLMRDYGVDPDRVVVIPPGVDTGSWKPAACDVSPMTPMRRLRLLFVGGDFARKGGDTLLDAWQAGLSGRCELDIVTRDPGVCSAPGLRVHRDLRPGTPALRALFAQADLLVLPTRGDASPFAVLEALASGVPVLTTRVGAIGEMVHDGREGRLMRPGDAAALLHAIDALDRDRPALAAMRCAARETAVRRFDGATNAARVLDQLEQWLRPGPNGHSGES